mmetsp:Transcript_12503/g.21033  ORF Transcript_12503/g.21033 Transcript_12503/m.21033 type:complete len:670 (-) Transcript_12503:399-2408(-)
MPLVNLSGENHVAQLLLGPQVVEEGLVQVVHHDLMGQLLLAVVPDLPDLVVGGNAGVLVGSILEGSPDAVRVPVLHLDHLDLVHLRHCHALEAEQASDVVDQGDRLVVADVAANVPHVSSADQPVLELSRELLVGVVLEDGPQLVLLVGEGVHAALKQRESLLVGLLEVGVLVVQQKLLLDLVEDFLEVLALHGLEPLDGLLEVVLERVVEAAPGEVEVIGHVDDVEGEVGAVRHVVELPEVLALHLPPNIGEEPALQVLAEATVVSVDLHLNDGLRPLELVVLLVPEVAVLPLLDQLGLGRVVLLLGQHVEVFGDEVVGGGEVQLFGADGASRILHLLEQLIGNGLAGELGAVPLRLLRGLPLERLGPEKDADSLGQAELIGYLLDLLLPELVRDVFGPDQLAHIVVLEDLESRGKRHAVRDSSGLVGELEVHLAEVVHLLPHELLGARGSQLLGVLENGLHNLLVILQALLGERDVDLESGEAPELVVTARTELKCKPLGDQVAEDGVLALVAEEVREVAERLRLQILLVVGKDPNQGDDVLVLHGHRLHELAHILSGVGVGASEVGHLHVLVDDGGELLGHPLFETGDVVSTVDSEGHDVGRVPLLVEGKQRLPDAGLRQALEVATVESMQEALFVRQLLLKVEEVPGVALQGLVVLRVHSLDLPV